MDRVYSSLIEEARKLGSKEKWHQAIAKYEEAFEYAITIDDFLDYALIHLELSNIDEFLQILNDCEKIMLDYPRIYLTYGIYYEEIKDYPKAIEALNKAIAIDDTYEEAIFNLARIYDVYNIDEDLACKWYRRELEINPNDFWTNLNMGAIKEQNNQDEEALSYFLKTYQQNPNENMVLYNLGVAYYKLKDYNQAIKFYNMTIDHDLACYNLGNIYKELKQYEKSKKSFQKAIKLNKDDYRFWYNLGCLYAIIEDYKNAEECLIYANHLNNKVNDYIKEDPELENYYKKYLTNQD